MSPFSFFGEGGISKVFGLKMPGRRSVPALSDKITGGAKRGAKRKDAGKICKRRFCEGFAYSITCGDCLTVLAWADYSSCIWKIREALRVDEVDLLSLIGGMSLLMLIKQSGSAYPVLSAIVSTHSRMDSLLPHLCTPR